MLLVVAWDGADLDTVEPWIAAGELPVLASLFARGAVRPLESTRPPVTFPAWTSFLTASTPDRHGVCDFTQRDGYRLRFVNATDRALPTIFAVLAAQGRRVGTYGVPATYPPEPLSGFQVPGFDTPFGASASAGVTHPADLGRRLFERFGSLGIEGPSQVRIEPGWHEQALLRLLDTIEARARVFTSLLAEQRPDCAMVHFMESDTVSHQFRQFCDPRSPRYAPSPLCGAMLQVYRALDSALGALLSAAGADTDVMLLSDHGGAAASDRAICWNRWLADTGRLGFRTSVGAATGPMLKRAALRWLPRGMYARAFAGLPGLAGRLESGARFAGIDWAATRIFSEETPYQASFWLNLRGRDPEGTVEGAEAGRVLGELEDDLLALRDPFDGARVVRRVWRREQLYSGPFAERMPDLFVDLAEPQGCVYAAVPSRGGRESRAFRRLAPAEMTGSRGTVMPGAHSPHGFCVLAGERVVPGRYPVGSLHDAGATVLAAAAVGTTEAMNGRPWTDCFESLPATAVPVPVPGHRPPYRYGREEDELVAERLRALGYID